MKPYFLLQIKFTIRRLRDAGIEPAFACLALPVLFIVLSLYLFAKTPFAPYLYMLVSLAFTARLSEQARNNFLKMTFPGNQYRFIRLIENLAATLPFCILLLARQLPLHGLLLCILAALMALLRFGIDLQPVVPTPFYKKPFEFAAGFRKTWPLVTTAYILTGIAIRAGNFNLGIFSLLLLFVLAAGYYAKPENEWFVWVYAMTARQFLAEKIKTALLYASLLAMPALVILALFFHAQAGSLLLFLLAGYAFLLCMILAKYAAYPGEMGLPQGIFIAACVYFPPAALLVIPLFFIQSVNRLKTWLA